MEIADLPTGNTNSSGLAVIALSTYVGSLPTPSVRVVSGASAASEFPSEAGRFFPLEAGTANGAEYSWPNGGETNCGNPVSRCSLANEHISASGTSLATASLSTSVPCNTIINSPLSPDFQYKVWASLNFDKLFFVRKVSHISLLAWHRSASVVVFPPACSFRETAIRNSRTVLCTVRILHLTLLSLIKRYTGGIVCAEAFASQLAAPILRTESVLCARCGGIRGAAACAPAAVVAEAKPNACSSWAFIHLAKSPFAEGAAGCVAGASLPRRGALANPIAPATPRLLRTLLFARTFSNLLSCLCCFFSCRS
mmetsp:Transcript_38316/g.83708  ORF Transcript_38316/g.83708 Transcript_38316/m.83708 type:complete len:311 (+) Transcript_38316:298-1230(+)